MLIENGKVVAVEQEHLWVETIQKSTCGSCEAESGCGQGLMARFFLGSRYLKVFLEGRSPDVYAPGDAISIGIPEGVVVKISFLAYLIPLTSMLIGITIGHLQGGDLYAAAGALVGLGFGAWAVRLIARRFLQNRNYQPVIVDDVQPISLNH